MDELDNHNRVVFQNLNQYEQYVAEIHKVRVKSDSFKFIDNPPVKYPCSSSLHMDVVNGESTFQYQHVYLEEAMQFFNGLRSE